MSNNNIRCGILGGQEKDLTVLSELHRQTNVQIAFVYDREPTAVGLEIAEILGIPRPTKPGDLEGFNAIDYVVVSEPRARFADELKVLSESGAKILNPTGALKLLCARGESAQAIPLGYEGAEPHTIEDTITALERLLDRKELLKFLLEVSVKATSSSAGSIMLYSPETKELYIAYAIGLSERVIKNTRQKLGEGIAGTVALRKEAQLLRVSADKGLYARDRERMDIASAICVPLVWGERLLGVVNVSSGKKSRPHSEKDLSQLKALSRRLSRVLSESLKLQQVQMRHRESKFRTTMGEIAEKDVPTNEKLSILTQYLAELMGAETVDVYMTTVEGDWLVLGGSNRWLTPKSERIRCHKGALGRSFLEKRCIVLTETVEPGDDPLPPLSSVVYCHMPLRDASGVVVLEFKDRYKLDEFLVAKDAIVLEVARFVASELRERQLRRKLAAFARVSDAAATLLGCRSVDELGSVLTRVVSDVLECDRVSVRLRSLLEDDRMDASYLSPPGEPVERWQIEDENRFANLAQKGEPFSVAFLDFDSQLRSEPGDYHSLLAYPILGRNVFHGGIIAYEKRPRDPMEDAVFTELDQAVLENLTRLVLPVLDTIHERRPAEAEGQPEVYESVLQSNLDRFSGVCESEISRSDRYHHPFAVILFRVVPLTDFFEKDHKRAFALVDEITQGLRTRTRKTDFGCWISRTTYAMVSLEAGTRIRFLVTRAMQYLMKDLAEAAVSKQDIQIGTATYPGSAQTAEEVIKEAERNLRPQSDD